MEVGGGIIYLSLHCHHLNDFSIMMGSDESHFNVSLIVRTKSQDSVHRPQLLKRKESQSGFEPRSLRLPLVQTGSLNILMLLLCYLFVPSLHTH